jgi:hypothetical protein
MMWLCQWSICMILYLWYQSTWLEHLPSDVVAAVTSVREDSNASHSHIVSSLVVCSALFILVEGDRDICWMCIQLCTGSCKWRILWSVCRTCEHCWQLLWLLLWYISDFVVFCQTYFRLRYFIRYWQEKLCEPYHTLWKLLKNLVVDVERNFCFKMQESARVLFPWGLSYRRS